MRRMNIEYVFDNTYSGLIPRVCKRDESLNAAIGAYSVAHGLTSLSFSEQIYLFRYNFTTPPVCKCGNPVKYLAIMRGYNTFCSRQCKYAKNAAKVNSEKTKLEKYGDPTYSAPEKRVGWFANKTLAEQSLINSKREATNLAVYGAATPLLNSEVKLKGVATSLLKFGHQHHMSSENVKATRDQAHREKYGVNNPFQRKDVQQRIQGTVINRYGVDHISQSSIVRDKIALTIFNKSVDSIFNNVEISPMFDRDVFLKFDNTTEYKWKCNRCGFEFVQRFTTTRRRPFCSKCDTIHVGSAGERELADFVESMGFEIVRNHKFTHNGIRRELDIFIPMLNTGIEYNGIYWHSDKIRAKSYHKDKLDFFQELGIRVMFVWENDWMKNKALILDRIRHKLGKTDKQTIYARKTTVAEINIHDYREFLTTHHYQGYTSSTFRYGLYYNGTIVSVMGLSKTSSRPGIGNTVPEYELVRFCSSENVVGGMSKLFSHFVKVHNPITVITYSMNEFNTGKSYTSMGFEYKKDTQPGYWYIDTQGNRFHRYKYNKLALVRQGHDPKLTEFEIMDNEPFHRVYDAGNKIYIWNRNDINT